MKGDGDFPPAYADLVCWDAPEVSPCSAVPSLLLHTCLYACHDATLMPVYVPVTCQATLFLHPYNSPPNRGSVSEGPGILEKAGGRTSSYCNIPTAFYGGCLPCLLPANWTSTCQKETVWGCDGDGITRVSWRCAANACAMQTYPVEVCMPPCRHCFSHAGDMTLVCALPAVPQLPTCSAPVLPGGREDKRACLPSGGR